MTTVDFIGTSAIAVVAFAWGWMVGAHYEWSKAHNDACAVTKAHAEHIAELRKRRDVELANGARVVAAKIVVDKLLAAKQRRLRGVLSEARRWKQVAVNFGWRRPTQANIASLGSTARETMERETD